MARRIVIALLLDTLGYQKRDYTGTSGVESASENLG